MGIYKELFPRLSPTFFHTTAVEQHLQPPSPLHDTNYLRFSSVFLFSFHIYFGD